MPNLFDGEAWKGSRDKKSSGSDGANIQTKSARNGESPLNGGNSCNSVSDYLHRANSGIR